MEMASASGITLVKEEERDILKSTTFGVGEMIKDAINKGIRNFIIGIGGSATNDCGTGMLRALGFEFLDKDNNEVEFGCKGLFDCVKIESKNALKELKDCSFNIACDVKNPLTGKNGCSYIYGPQKGGTKESIPLMDEAIGNFAELCKTYNKDADPEFPGAGAAGGLGFAFKYFLNAELKPGIDIIIDKTGIEDKIKTSDLVITGEGRLDNQTSMGKAPSGIAALSKKYNKPCIALSGCIGEGANICNDIGIDAYFPILQNVVTLDEALNKENAYKNTVSTTIQVMNLIKTFNNKF